MQKGLKMNIHQIKTVLDKIAPIETQSDWDNSGVQICFGPKNIKKILVALEINDAVIDEAVSLKADMIVTHHPLIFNPIKSLHFCKAETRYVMRLIQENIVVYSSHTPFDIAKGGNTDYLLKLLGVKNIKIVPGTDSFLKVGSLSKVTTLGEFAYKVAKVLNLDGLKFTGEADKKIKNVSCCTGAGGEFWLQSVGVADVLVTGDVKHHEGGFANDSGLAIIDAGHWGTEQIFVPNMANQLKSKLGTGVKIIESKVNQDPFNFMV